jgi:putative PIN family toxin of toxin-antitoxin system
VKKKVLIDTNVLFSIFLFPNKNMNEVKYRLSNYYKLIISSYVVNELYDIVKRKFPERECDIDEFLKTLPHKFYASKQEYNERKHPEIRDIDDRQVLVDAIYSGAHLLLTGDKDILSVDMKKRKKPIALKPAQFLDRY